MKGIKPYVKNTSSFKHAAVTVIVILLVLGAGYISYKTIKHVTGFTTYEMYYSEPVYSPSPINNVVMPPIEVYLDVSVDTDDTARLYLLGGGQGTFETYEDGMYRDHSGELRWTYESKYSRDGITVIKATMKAATTLLYLFEGGIAKAYSIDGESTTYIGSGTWTRI